MPPRAAAAAAAETNGIIRARARAQCELCRATGDKYTIGESAAGVKNDFEGISGTGDIWGQDLGEEFVNVVRWGIGFGSSFVYCSVAHVKYE